MREIKFRAWDSYGSYMTDPFTLKSAIRLRPMADETAGREYMQFTGLLDKNGKEIYEGDIVKDDYRSEVFKIEWRDLQAQWSIGGFNYEHIEVIGNIYENPDLLK